MGVYIGEPIIISDMQGPAPDGFHVPSKDEWVALCGVLTGTFGMANNATTMGTYLKMPMAGYRYYYNASVSFVGSNGYYWSSTLRDANYAYHLLFNSSEIAPQYNYYCAYGLSVRCFKDSPIIPTSSWTVLYQGSGNAGVFWNNADGLISVSGDGTTWYTIQDKNLGATTVFNQGDTLTDANCGYFYQWGNNYGFAHSGTVTTSSTRVDASNYGPGNYYESSTFIIGRANWSSVQNNNLRGGVSQGSSTKGVELKNAYIGEYRVPSSNTIAYYEFDGNLNDSSGNGRNASSSYGTITYPNSEYISLNSGGVYFPSGYSNGPITDSITVNVWWKNNGETSDRNIFVLGTDYSGAPTTAGRGFAINYTTSGIRLMAVRTSPSVAQVNTSQYSVSNVWHNIVGVAVPGDNMYLYIDGVLKETKSFGNNIRCSTVSSIGSVTQQSQNAIKADIDNLIIENKVRTAQEIADYYNQTKSNYGL